MSVLYLSPVPMAVLIGRDDRVSTGRHPLREAKQGWAVDVGGIPVKPEKQRLHLNACQP